MKTIRTYEELIAKIKQLEQQLEQARTEAQESSDIINAIRAGEIDALVIKSPEGPELFTLKSSDHTYRMFIEQMMEGAVTLTREGHILYSNSRFADMLNVSLEDVIGHSFTEMLKEDFRDPFARQFAAAWTEGRKIEAILDHQTDHVPVLLSLNTLEVNEVPSMSVIITDLSEQKRTQLALMEKNTELSHARDKTEHVNANLEHIVQHRTQELETTIEKKSRVEQELRSNEERLSKVLETIAEGICITDTNGRFTYANPVAQQLLNLRKVSPTDDAEYFEHPHWNLHHLDGAVLSLEEQPMNRVIALGTPIYDFEFAMITEGNDPVYISVNAAPMRDERGGISGCVGTFTDVTHRRKIIEQKDEFISVASHELRTPVTSLKASLQLLDRMKGNPSSEVTTTLIEQANKGLDKVSVLISDLLNATKMKNGQLHLNRRSFDICALIHDSSPHIRAMSSHQIITSGCDEAVPVFADPDKIDQVVVNFINNAVKYAPNSRDVKIKLERLPGEVKVSVSDEGPGVHPDKLPFLFDRFYRVDYSGRQYSGLGLGLYISSEIIRKHDGKIGVDSEFGKGSTFWFTLPV